MRRPQTSCGPTPCPGSGWRCSSAAWTPWPPSTVSPRRSPLASTGAGRTWSSTAGAASTPTIILHDGRSFGVVRQGLALRRRSLYDRLRAIAQYDYTRRPDAVLVLTPSVWEERLTTRFCINLNLDDCYVAVETRDALERRDLRLWHRFSWVGSSYRTLEDVSSHGSPGGRRSTASPERKRASLPRPERMAQTAPAFGVSPAEKRTLDLITDHPMIRREHLACWFGVSDGRVSQMMQSLVNTWGLVERRGKRGDTRYTLSAEGIRYVTHRDRAQLPTTQGIWSTALTTDRQGRRPDCLPAPRRALFEADDLTCCPERHHEAPNGSTFLEIGKGNFRQIPLVILAMAILSVWRRLVGPLHDRIIADERASRSLSALHDALLPKLV